jgi:hypothetical protein
LNLSINRNDELKFHLVGNDTYYLICGGGCWMRIEEEDEVLNRDERMRWSPAEESLLTIYCKKNDRERFRVEMLLTS